MYQLVLRRVYLHKWEANVCGWVTLNVGCFMCLDSIRLGSTAIATRPRGGGIIVIGAHAVVRIGKITRRLDPDEEHHSPEVSIDKALLLGGVMITLLSMGVF